MSETGARRAYIAGPLFDEGERWWIERVEQTVADCGLITFLPHRDNPPKDESNVAAIFANDRRGINESDVIVASLNGIITDDGTAWELGYAFALGKPIIGLHTDWRRRFDHEVINLMIECSLTVLLRSLDELPSALQQVVGDLDRSNTVRVVNIRETIAADLPAALALNNSSIPALNEIDAGEIERLVAMASLALTAEVDGAFAGFCITFPPGVEYASLNYSWFSRNYDDFVYLDRIAVDPAYRRLGIGKAFYDHVIQRFTGTYPRLFCEVNVRPRNEASLLFHHSIGFREVGQQDTDGGNKTVSLLALHLT